MNRLVVLSGCSGGGKSSLLEEMSNRGYDIVEEPGRRIIAEEQQVDGAALPWKDMEAFARKTIEMSLRDIARFSDATRWVFFDRGLVDAASALSHVTGNRLSEYLPAAPTYHRKVFLTPAWPEIYVTDTQRRHPLSAAVEEYERLLAAYPSIGYEVVVLPKTSIEARADFVLRQLEQ